MNPFVIKALYLAGGSGVVVGGAVATGVISTDWVSNLWTTPNAEVARLVDPSPKSVPKAVVPEKAKPEAEETRKPSAVIDPKFDILRLEEDGSLLVAGNAEPGSKVELIDPSGKVLGTTTAGPGGDFVILPDNPLAPGSHSLSLRATNPSGKSVLSKQAGILNVPKPGEDTALAMVTEEGAASRVITKPKMAKEKPTAPEPIEQATVAKPTPVKAAEKPTTEPETQRVVIAPKPEPAKAVEKAQVEPAPAAPNPEPEAKPEVVPSPSAPKVVVEAVEVEGEKVFVAGEAKRGALVRVYINNKPLGSAQGTADNRFLVARNFKLNIGNHSIRADVVSSSNGKVVARAEVPLLHEEATAVAPAAPQQPALKKETPAVVAEAPQKNAGTNDAVTEPVLPQAEPIRTGTAVIIKPGDNLWRISRRTYGAGIRYTTIYNANRDQIRDPSRIYVGQIFKIPETADPESEKTLN